MCHTFCHLYACSHERSSVVPCSLAPRCRTRQREMTSVPLDCDDCEMRSAQTSGASSFSQNSRLGSFTGSTSAGDGEWEGDWESPTIRPTIPRDEYATGGGWESSNITSGDYDLNGDWDSPNIPQGGDWGSPNSSQGNYSPRSTASFEFEEEEPQGCSERTIAGLKRAPLADHERIARENGGKVECTVCRNTIERREKVVKLPCDHWFCECVTTWLRRNRTCPTCRGFVGRER